MAYRLADTLAAHGPAEPLDIDAAMQALSLTLICLGELSVVLRTCLSLTLSQQADTTSDAHLLCAHQ